MERMLANTFKKKACLQVSSVFFLNMNKCRVYFNETATKQQKGRNTSTGQPTHPLQQK